EFDPGNSNIVYAGASTGGVFKSTDKGNTWFSVFDEMSVLPCGDIAVDPKNSDVIYVGTGEPNGSHNNMPGAGVFKSTDGGSSWNYSGLENTAQIGRILIDPVNTNNIYVAAVGSNFGTYPERGVYKSTDGGASWEQKLFVSDSTGAIDLVIDPTNPDFLLAAMWQRIRRPGFGQSESSFGPTGGLFKTTDGGESWTKLGEANGLPSEDDKIGRIGLALCQSKPNIIYALYNDGGSYTGLYVTTDYGETWTQKDTDGEIFNGTSAFSWYFGQIRVAPDDYQTIYPLDVAFMKSTDGGETFPIIYGYGGPSELHVDHHALAFAPDNPNYLISGNDGGINISTDGGEHWSVHKNLPITQFYEIGLDKQNPERYYGGTQDNSTIRTLTGSMNDWEIILGGDGFYVSVDPTNPDVIYAEYQWGNLMKSVNGGNGFFFILDGIDDSEPTNWSTPVVMDPNNNLVLYYGTNRLYKSTNGGEHWSPISPVLTTAPEDSRLGTLTTIDVAPTNSNYIYVGSDDSHVWVTKNGGAEWNDISSDLPERWATRVKADPQNEERVVVSFSGLKWRDPQPHLFLSENAGDTWTDIGGNLPDAPINAVAIDPYNQDIIYIGNDVGAFVTFNSGADWEILGNGMPSVSVYDLKIHPTEYYLVAGTFGRSMYKIDLHSVTEISSNETEISEFKLEQNYPNPFNPTTQISYSLGKEEEIKLTVYDITGRVVKILANERRSKGNYKVVFNAVGLSSGIYIYTLETESFTNSRKMILLK
ncbi:MAG: T9SS type A sorting domain-containing protein, partial [Chlorobi bacterium]|nr:T9SS type A sorting domain-containing protein [Chlorobiota bacterium]